MTGQNKTSAAQLRAIRRYESKNPELKRYNSKKSTAKNFILKTATDEDINLVKEWIAEREKQSEQQG